MAAVAGVMIADYYFIRSRELKVEDLYKVDGIYPRWNPIAIVALVAGIAPNVPGFLSALLGNDAVTKLPVFPVSSFWSTTYEWAWFVAFFIGAGVHLLGTKLLGKK